MLVFLVLGVVVLGALHFMEGLLAPHGFWGMIAAAAAGCCSSSSGEADCSQHRYCMFATARNLKKKVFRRLD
jgi:hypothetical protein